ncbi:hypothetical protein LY78DRAFT_495546 [Colletotrichum sublineola]|nr:hypothetical protein LY78DRAFT_495546 [Colletotrichum sublineola]
MSRSKPIPLLRLPDGHDGASSSVEKGLRVRRSRCIAGGLCAAFFYTRGIVMGVGAGSGESGKVLRMCQGHDRDVGNQYFHFDRCTG